MHEVFKEIRFQKKTLELIEQINAIVEEYYVGQGVVMSSRQVFYQLVARNIIPNDDKGYFLALRTVRRGRMSGKIDWDAIEDRVREWVSCLSYANPAEALQSTAAIYAEDPWLTQIWRPEI